MRSEIPFLVFAAITLVSAISAMMLRNLVHCALCVAASLIGVAAIYLKLDAQFVGFAQVLVYVGAVAILILFTILLTRGTEIRSGARIAAPGWLSGLIAAALLFVTIGMPILGSRSLDRLPPPNVQAPVKAIGDQLMTRFVVPLETIGLLLTAALLGGVVIAIREKKPSPPRDNFAMEERGDPGRPSPRFDPSLLTKV